MQAGFSFLDIVFLIVMAVFIVSRFMSSNLPKEDKKNKPKNVVPFPEAQKVVKTTSVKTKKTDKEKLSTLTGLDLIIAADKNFNKKEFLSGAESAYTMYYDALNSRDEETLESFLSPRKLDEIMEEIESLEETGKQRYVLVSKVKKPEILESRLHGRTAILEVKYTATQKDFVKKMDIKNPTSPKLDKEVSTVWTWARSIDSQDLNWELESISLLS